LPLQLPDEPLLTRISLEHTKRSGSGIIVDVALTEALRHRPISVALTWRHMGKITHHLWNVGHRLGPFRHLFAFDRLHGIGAVQFLVHSGATSRSRSGAALDEPGRISCFGERV